MILPGGSVSDLFGRPNFAGGNLATAFVYGGLALGSLVIALYTQEVVGFSATAAGLGTLPIPVLSFLFARHVGDAATRIGPRMFLIAGPVIAAVGLLLIRPTANGFNIISQLLPGMTLFCSGIGSHRHTVDLGLHVGGGSGACGVDRRSIRRRFERLARRHAPSAG
jgi:predicted MFS family arabinose efflux permease